MGKHTRTFLRLRLDPTTARIQKDTKGAHGNLPHAMSPAEIAFAVANGDVHGDGDSTTWGKVQR